MDYVLSEQAYLAFAAFLHKKLGIVLGSNRHYLVKSRLSAIARDVGATDINVFLKDIIDTKNRELTDRCLELMTTNETFWFRDGYPFELLQSDVLPTIAAKQKNLRIWSSACASGQEPYSIAMTIRELQNKMPGAFSGGVEIKATDFSDKMIKHASKGYYDELMLGRGLPADMKTKYFQAIDDKFMQVNRSISSIVKFERFNLLSEYTGHGKFDVIFCRNVLIYFNATDKASILKKLAACLHPNGILFLGAAESISGAESLFKMKTMSKGLYYTKL